MYKASFGMPYSKYLYTWQKKLKIKSEKKGHKYLFRIGDYLYNEVN